MEVRKSAGAVLAFFVGSILVPIFVAYGVAIWSIQNEREDSWQQLGVHYRAQAGEQCLDFQSWVVDARRPGLSASDIHSQAGRAFAAASVNERVGEEEGYYFIPCGAQGRSEIEALIDALLKETPE